MTKLDQNTIYFIKLVRQYLESHGKDVSIPEFAPEADLEEILHIAAKNRCDALIYHIICKWGADCTLSKDTLELCKNHVLLTAVSQMRSNAELKKVISELNSTGVNYLLLKGALIAKLYPNPEYRYSCDADFIVGEELLESTAEMLTSRGYQHVPAEGIRYGKAYQLSDILTIELHTKLFEDFYDKNQRVMTALEFESGAHHTEVSALGTIVKTLTPDHSLIHLICHHTKHFISSGINLRHLIDICLYVNEHNDHLDWGFITSSLERLNIKDFALYMLYICTTCLGMADVSFLFLDAKIEDEVIDLLIYDIVERNAALKESAFVRGSVRDIVRSVYFEDKGSGTLKRGLFPSARMLKNKYSYAIKHPILLPVAWIHRAFSYILQRIRGKKVLSPSERAAIAEERVELLKRVRIM